MSHEEYLSDWTYNYIRHKDIILKRIVDIEKKGSGFLVTFNDRKASYEPMVSLKDFSKAVNEASIVTFNTAENFQLLLKEWKKFVGKKLTVIFINPESNLDRKWMVATHVHDAICDRASLRQGMKSMFETVEPLDEEKIRKLVSGSDA